MESNDSPAPLERVVGPVLGAKIATPHTAISWRAWATDPPSHNGYFLIIRLSKFDRGEDTLWAEESQRWEDGPGAKPGMYVSDGDGDSPIDETEILYWCDLPSVPNPLFKAKS